MRVSCTSFVRFFDHRGNYGLLVNKNQKDQGKTVLSPVGGALEVKRSEGNKIMRTLGLAPADFDKPPTKVVELRFMIDDSLLDQVRALYKKLNTSPARELYEELVDETGILKEAELNGHVLRFAGYAEEERASRRSGKAAGQMTLRLAAVYDLGPRQLVARLLDASETSPLLHYVSRAEILEGYTKKGIEVAPVSKLLLDPKK